MVLKGLRAREGFARIGQLRKGGPKQQRKGKDGQVYETYGEDLKWFRFTTERADVMEAFRAAYGEQPAEFEVYLPYTTVEQNFVTGRAKYVRGGLEFECDGQDMTMWRGDDGRMIHGRKPCPYCSGQVERTTKDPGCVQYGRLTVQLVALLEAGYVGPVTIETHSWNDLASIMGSLEHTASLRAGNPMGLRGIRWKVYRIPEKISTPQSQDNRKARARREKWLVKLEPAATWVQALHAAQEAAGLLADPRRAHAAQQQSLLALEAQLAQFGAHNAAHMLPDPRAEEEAPRYTERDLAPLVEHRATAGRLFKTEAPRRLAPDPTEPEEPEEAQFITVESSAPEETPPDPAPETTEQAPHWIKDARARDGFWALAGNLGMDKEQVHAALGVEHCEQYPGTEQEARKRLTDYAAEQANKRAAASRAARKAGK